ncbi:beta-glucosidase BglX [Xanthomonas sp. WHRI 1810A]|uniref:beta-glucosidase BglX n=1 Tax=Xanthomonas sp. WHRI 1810A TaxID=3161565 RepID=UPI0032E8CBB1
MNKLCLLGLFIGLASQSVLAASTDADVTKLQAKNAFIAKLMKQMTLDEKIGQLRLISIGPEMPREAILKEIAAGRIGGTFNSVVLPDNRAMQDAAVAHSRMKIPMFFAYDVVHGQRTVFPISLGLAASWDMDAITQTGRISAIEAAADGLDMTFAPMVDITRDARWGRSSEGFGEDTYLVSRISSTITRAFQGSSTQAPDSIMAAVKHFALYGAVEGGRDYNTVDMSPTRMRQDYLPPYRAAIDAGAGGVMVALNSINGVPATANAWLLQDVLRKEWGFKGVTVSDHGAIKELIDHGIAKDFREAAKLAIKAGVDLSMNDKAYGEELPDLVKTGEVSIKDVDNAVREVLGAKWEMGLFASPFLRIGDAANDPIDRNAESRLHRDAARDVARKSIVLLKNANETLPLKKQGTIAVIGPLAKSSLDMMGSWSAAGLARQTVSAYDGLANAVGDKAKLVFAVGANVTDNQEAINYLNNMDDKIGVDPRPAQEMIDEAVKVAQQSDVIVAVVGESRNMSHEAASRVDIVIPGRQRDLIKALKATGKPLVLVLMNGRPLALGPENEMADAMVESWFLGTEGGNALADVLFGDYNPSGKLAMTFPRSVGQVPSYYNHLNTGRPYRVNDSNYTSNYFEEPTGPLFAFGYGLSYTQFSVSDVKLSAGQMTRKDKLTASVTVKNTGKVAGATVVQLYLRDLAASISRPVKELKNFEKVMLQPGEEKVVTFTLTEEDLKFVNPSLKYAAEAGDFKVMIGLDSVDVKEAGLKLL